MIWKYHAKHGFKTLQACGSHPAVSLCVTVRVGMGGQGWAWERRRLCHLQRGSLTEDQGAACTGELDGIII